MSKETTTEDTRAIVRGISFPGPYNADTGKRGPMVVVTDVQELQQLADAGKTNLRVLFESGAISGGWDFPK